MSQTNQKIENLKLLFPEIERALIVTQWAHPRDKIGFKFKKLQKMMKDVLHFYEDKPYTITQDRIDRVNQWIDKELARVDLLANIRYKRYLKSLEDSCPICLEARPDVVLSECRHYGHLKCLAEMVENGVTKCPLCRKEVRHCIDLESDVVLTLFTPPTVPDFTEGLTPRLRDRMTPQDRDRLNQIMWGYREDSEEDNRER